MLKQTRSLRSSRYSSQQSQYSQYWQKYVQLNVRVGANCKGISRCRLGSLHVSLQSVSIDDI